jgi:NitT/TauT family transport system substrate-binding protein
MKNLDSNTGRIKRLAPVLLTCSAITTLLVVSLLLLSRDSDPDVVRIGYLPFASDLALFVANEKGYFRDEGIRVELVRFQSANDNLNALLARRIEISGMLGFPTLFAAFEKDMTGFRTFLGTAETESNWASAIIVRTDSTIHSIADLNGKTIGTYSGTTQLLNLKSILSHSLNPDRDVTIRQFDSSLQLAALESGQVDALFTIEPAIATAVSNGSSRILVDNPRNRYIMRPFPVTACAVSTEFHVKHPRTVEAVYKALVRATNDIRNDPASARVLLSKYTDLELGLVGKVGLYHWWLPDEVDYPAIQRLSEIFVEQGLLQKAIETRQMFVDPLAVSK